MVKDYLYSFRLQGDSEWYTNAIVPNDVNNKEREFIRHALWCFPQYYIKDIELNHYKKLIVEIKKGDANSFEDIETYEVDLSIDFDINKI